MLLTELLTHLTRVFFVLLVAITTVDYLLHHDRIRRDIALVFLCLSASILIGLFRSITGIDFPWMSKIGQLALVAQPYLLLRLVKYFRFVPVTVERGAIAGLLIMWSALILAPTPLPTEVTISVVLYFAIVNGYVVVAFIQGALQTGGVTRQRLRFAAAGSGLLSLALLIAGVRVILPTSALDITSLLQLLSVLSSLAYYISFAPPRWLRYGWKFTELRNYLLPDTEALRSQLPTEILERLRLAIVGTINTNKVSILLWDEKTRTLISQNTQEIDQLATIDLNSEVGKGAIKAVWEDKLARVVYHTSELTRSDADLMKAVDAEALYLVPIATGDHTLGLILVFLEYGSLFVDDDLKLLTIFAQQTAIILENIMILEQQRRYAEDLEHKVQQRTAALQRSNEELRQFAHVVSHDLKEPLRMVSSYMQLIESQYGDKLDKDGHEYIGFAVDGAARMKNLIDDLLTYAHVQPQSQNFEVFDMQLVMDEVCRLLHFTIAEAGAIMEVDPLPQIRGDQRLITQLFQNLVSNAIKYQKDRQPHIRIKSEKQKNEWIFSVQDNGIGIEASNLDRIFVIFQRLHGRGEYAGTGIGLAICKKVVEHHDGRIWVESEVGKGSTFYFSIPA